MKPKQYTVSVYRNTQTLENIKNGFEVVLQVLHLQNIDLIRPLGKKSGKIYDKKEYLRKRKLLTKWKNYDVLYNACAYIALKPIQFIDTKGDHKLIVFEMTDNKTNNEKNVLMFQHLIDAGMIL